MIRKEVRDGGEGVERGLRWKHKRSELTIEEEDKEHLHLPLLVSSRHCVSSEFLTRFCSKALQQTVKYKNLVSSRAAR